MALRTLDSRKCIILLGKTGKGKSSLGNSLLGMDAFFVGQSLTAVSRECQKMANNNICVTDTPGLLDTEHHVADIALKILSSLNECPNPHAFIIVFSAFDRMSHDELRTINLLRLIFTERCLDHAIVVFTGYSEKNSDSDFEHFWKSHDLMRHFVETCGGRVCRIDNNSSERSNRVEEILLLVDEVSNNGTKRFDSRFKNLHEDVLRKQQQRNEELEEQRGDDPISGQSLLRRFDEEIQEINTALFMAYFENAQGLEKNIIVPILIGFACVAGSFISIGLAGKLAFSAIKAGAPVVVSAAKAGIPLVVSAAKAGIPLAVSAAKKVYSLARSAVSFRSMLEMIQHIMNLTD